MEGAADLIESTLPTGLHEADSDDDTFSPAFAFLFTVHLFALHLCLPRDLLVAPWPPLQPARGGLPSACPPRPLCWPGGLPHLLCESQRQAEARSGSDRAVQVSESGLSAVRLKAPAVVPAGRPLTSSTGSQPGGSAGGSAVPRPCLPVYAFSETCWLLSQPPCITAACRRIPSPQASSPCQARRRQAQATCLSGGCRWRRPTPQAARTRPA